MTNNLGNRFAKPKPNLRKILETNSFDAHQEVPSFFVTKEEVEIQRGKFYYCLARYKITLTQESALALQMEYSVAKLMLTYY